MSEYNTEKVLQWVNSSEAKAAKYEQEAKVSGPIDSEFVVKIFDVPKF